MVARFLSGGRITYSSADLLRYSILRLSAWARRCGRPSNRLELVPSLPLTEVLRLDVGSSVSAESWLQLPLQVEVMISYNYIANFALWNARSVKNKTHMISDLVSSHHTDALVITETWLTGDARDNRTLAELNSTLPSHQFLHSPRIDRTGGGLGVCLHKNFTVNQVECEPMESFEYMELRISCSGRSPLHLVAVYRPQRKKDRSSTSARFFEEFATLLERLVTDPSHLVITGDFNFHVNDQNDNESTTQLPHTSE